MIALCDITGLRLHRECGDVLQRTSQSSLSGFGMNQKDLDSLSRCRHTARIERPHVLVGSDKQKRKTEATAHVCTTALPRGSLLRLKDGIHVASLPICLSQMATGMDPLDLIRLLYEVCSEYELYEMLSDGLGEVGEEATVGVRGAEPLTSTKKLRAQLNRLSGFPGARIVLEALDCVSDNSNSPRETDLAMWAWCKRRWGGFEFRVGTMNQPISIDGNERRCDLFFGKERVGVEYDSDEFHAGTGKNAADSARKKQIENKGYRIVSITNGELKDFDQAVSAMKLLGTHLGLRVRDPRTRTSKARKRLHKYINGKHRMLY